MAKTDKICAYCGKNIIDYKNSKMTYFSNVALDEQYFFCNPTCKKAWLAERLEKSKDKFYCQYCDKDWSSSRSRSQHERHCPKNPAVVLKESEKENYTIEDLRKIDRTLELTDEQIARFVRGSRSNK